MAAPFRVSLAVLVVGGLAQGIALNAAKVAGQRGLAPVPYFLHALLVAVLLLGLVAGLRGTLPRPRLRLAEFALAAGLLTIAAGWLSVIFTAPIVGASFLSLITALIPLLTYVAALSIGMERFSPPRAVGVALALAGAVVLGLGQLALPDVPALWILVALLMPVSLASGNIYRALRWPASLEPEAASLVIILGAVPWVVLASMLTGRPLALPASEALPLIFVQGATMALQVVALFILLRSSGPVFQSLMAVSAALAGVLIAIFHLGEAPPRGLILAATLILAGVLVTGLARRA